MTHAKDWFAAADPHPRDENARLPPALPLSIADLGRLSAAAKASADRYDKANGPELPKNDWQELLAARDGAFRNLLVTFRAKTLSDAAVQLYAGWCAAHRLWSEQDGTDETILYRVFLSVLPVIAAAAEIDFFVEIGAGDLPDFVARGFRRRMACRARLTLPDERSHSWS